MVNEPTDKIKAYFEEFSELTNNQNSSVPPDNINADSMQSFFQKLSPLYQNSINSGALINVWDISGLKRDEVRNTAVLAWWLDCQGSHGLGAQLLTRIMSDLETNFNILSIENKPYRTRPESLPLGELESRIDIEISSNTALIFWEVKIDAKESKGQLTRYHDLLNAKANDKQEKCLIYLTTESGKKRHETALTYGITWSQLAKTLSCELNKISNNSLSKILLSQYCEYISKF